jgi:hypothetical protein
MAKGPLSAAAERGGAGWLEPLDGDAMGLQSVGDSHQRTSGADSLGERRYPTSGLLPDLSAKPVAVPGDDVWIVELVGRVVARQERELPGSSHHVLNVL